MKILVAAGTRPNFVKVAPLLRELERRDGEVRWQLVHTGQHYDDDMFRVFFEELDIPDPRHFLNIGSGSHAEQTAAAMLSFEKVCRAEGPDAVVVVGDVNSTLACALTAKKMGIPVAHVEAGLRSGDPSMPEEINRILTDAMADYLFVTERSGVENLLREGRSEERIFLVGNVMIDTLLYGLEKVRKVPSGSRPSRPYAVLTLHRPANVDRRDVLEGILSAAGEIAQDMALYFPVHPRTRSRISEFGLGHLLDDRGATISGPMSYLEFLSLWKDSTLVLTDSGGLQEETTALGVPCLTLRENTERPVTIEEGTNRLAGTERGRILAAYGAFRKNGLHKGKVPDLWDGRAAARIVDRLLGKGAAA